MEARKASNAPQLSHEAFVGSLDNKPTTVSYGENGALRLVTGHDTLLAESCESRLWVR